MKKGPVGSTTLDVLNENLEYLDEEDINQLVDLTHKYPEWKQYENDFLNEVRKHADIETVELFSVIQNDPLGVDPKRAEISREIFCGCEK